MCARSDHSPHPADQRIDPKMGPGPAVGEHGGFMDAGTAAFTGHPVVGPGFGPGGVNATPGAQGEYDPLENDHRVPMAPTDEPSSVPG